MVDFIHLVLLLNPLLAKFKSSSSSTDPFLTDKRFERTLRKRNAVATTGNEMMLHISSIVPRALIESNKEYTSSHKTESVKENIFLIHYLTYVIW